MNEIQNCPKGKLTHILRNETDATFFVNSPRGGNVYKVRSFKSFLETYDKAESGTKMEAERINPKGDSVQIWIRGFGTNSYMLQTDADNVLIDIPAA